MFLKASAAVAGAGAEEGDGPCGSAAIAATVNARHPANADEFKDFFVNTNSFGNESKDNKRSAADVLAEQHLVGNR
jgi:hypothetical protein